MALCNGQKPEELTFDIARMRRHLCQCIEDGVMRHFPSSCRRRRRTVDKTEEVLVYCKCRLQEDGDMISCETCGEWFHSTCEDIPSTAWTEQ